MRILLIYPYFLEERVHEEELDAPPLGIFYVGALLKDKGYDVEILNWRHLRGKDDVIQETLKSKNPDVLGFSVLQANRWGAIDIAGIAKGLNPEVAVVFGGIGATFLWKHFLKHFPEIDYCVLGEGEYPFLKLVQTLEKNSLKQLKNIKGIAFRKQGKPFKTNRGQPLRNLDDLPVPSKYFDYRHVAFTRGCPGNCTFCGSPRFWGRSVRLHSADYFVTQLALLHDRGIRFFYFSDDTFMIKGERVIDICREILNRDLHITWYAISRVDLVNDEVLYWMRKAGCIQISYGVESGSEKIRKFLNKTIQTEQIQKAFQLTTRHGILARAYFIYGCPGETWDTIQETLDLIQEIKPLSAIFYILDIFPGTALYDLFLRQTGQNDDIWLQRVEDILYFETDSNMDPDLILAFGKKLRSTFYRALPDYAKAISLSGKTQFRESNADFLSRLAMTFARGDYSKIPDIPEKDETAEALYKKSLNYAPNDRAYLGLGMMRQQRRAFDESVRILKQGLDHFPKNDSLKLCLGISHMNLGEFKRAVSCFSTMHDLSRAAPYFAECEKHRD